MFNIAITFLNKTERGQLWFFLIQIQSAFIDNAVNSAIKSLVMASERITMLDMKLIRIKNQ